MRLADLIVSATPLFAWLAESKLALDSCERRLAECLAFGLELVTSSRVRQALSQRIDIVQHHFDSW
jgi:hypothetical protein